ncbi:MAG: glycosyltransferase [Acidobacteria bacterium]|nr:glycosyltransferase [Acidobacteriota bacterium]
MAHDTLAVVPTYNEAESLPVLIEHLMRIDGLKVLVVDDDSPDGTGQIADELAASSDGRISVLHRTTDRGLGRAYVAGLLEALETQARFICQMDADLSHDPSSIPGMVRRAADADVVVGSRYVNGISVVNWPLRRLVMSLGANRYVRFVTGIAVNDATSGFRCWRREALAQIELASLRSRGYSFLVEMLYRVHRRDLRIAEEPIIFVERRHGRSKLSAGVFLESLWTPWRLRFGRS